MSTNTKELSEIIAKAINDEPFLNKQTLIPKINAIIRGFRITLDITNYNKNLTPTEQEKLIRRFRIKELENKFWKDKLREIVGEEKMKALYIEQDSIIEPFKS